MPSKIKTWTRLPAAKALLLAGLSLFLVRPAFADETIPSRTIAPEVTPSPLPTLPPSVSPDELKAAEVRMGASVQDLAQKSLEQDRQMEKSLDALSGEIQILEKAQGDTQAQLAKQGEDLVALEGEVAASKQKLAEGLQGVEDIRAAIEKKGERMEDLLDIVNTLKNDMNDTSMEIANIKSDMQKLQTLVQNPSEDQSWWEPLVSWKYLPAAATLLSVVALGFAASHQ